MITLKIKYNCSNSKHRQLIWKIISQYNSAFRICFNLYQKQITPKILNFTNKYNNVELLDSWLISSAINDAKFLYNKVKNTKIIFGGKQNYSKRVENKISLEKYRQRRLKTLYSIGERSIGRKRVYGNRKFKINSNLSKVIFKVGQEKIDLNLLCNKHIKNQLQIVYRHQVMGDLPITYNLNSEYIYITFDEHILNTNINQTNLPNRILGIDLNPNYIGYSIIDWISSKEFKVITSGIYSLKSLNDHDFNLNNKGLKSSSKERKYIANKRHFELLEISKHLTNLAKHYKCSIFSIEELQIKSKNTGKGHYYNHLVNNMWCRKDFIKNIEKRCNINNIKCIFVRPEYSSFIGNIVFRSLKLPDMVLSSIEISRRGFEYNRQYLDKVCTIKKNIVQPLLCDFEDLIIKSLEEFNIKEKYKDLIELYYIFKKSKIMYRLSLDQFDLKFSSLNSRHSKVSYIQFCK